MDNTAMPRQRPRRHFLDLHRLAIFTSYTVVKWYDWSLWPLDQGPLRVIRVGFVMEICPVCPNQQTFLDPVGTSHSCHVWTAPDWQELSSRLQGWSVRPCVRPVDAVRMTAGHNALRGSGPGQKPAFDYALAQMGCPDRRIDRLCITCC
jgi:hypothetical protein